MTAQSEFLIGMSGFRFARKHAIIVDQSPTEIEHNARSKTFRNGIAIIGFSILEHFIRERTGELMHAFQHVQIPFEDLPKRIKKKATSGAIAGIKNRMNYNHDPIGFAQNETAIIASSLNPNYHISKYSIGWDRANLHESEIKSIFSCFGIDKGWIEIGKISTRIGLNIISPKTAFNNAAQRRHNAAHNIKTEIQPTELEAFVKEAYVIAIGFDMLVSTAFHKILSGVKEYLLEKENKKISADDVKFRTISKRNNIWRENRENSRRAAKVAATALELWPDAEARANNNKEVIFQLDSEGLPSRWKFPFIP